MDVPLNVSGALLADGRYRLDAVISGTPEFSASASFDVKNVVGGPIVDPSGTGIKGLAKVGPVTPVTIQGVPNVKPLPGAVIKFTEIRKIGVLYIYPPARSAAGCHEGSPR